HEPPRFRALPTIEQSELRILAEHHPRAHRAERRARAEHADGALDLGARIGQPEVPSWLFGLLSAGRLDQCSRQQHDAGDTHQLRPPGWRHRTIPGRLDVRRVRRVPKGDQVLILVFKVGGGTKWIFEKPAFFPASKAAMMYCCRNVPSPASFRLAL